MKKHQKEIDLLPHYAKCPKGYHSPYSVAILEEFRFPHDGHMLDLGCGDGRAMNWAAMHRMTYVGIDYSPERIRSAQDLRKELGAFYPPGYQLPLAILLCMDLYKYLEAEVETYSAVLCLEVLEHLEEPELALMGLLGRVEKQGGVLLASVPNNMPYVAHLQVYDGIREASEAFRPHEIEIKSGHIMMRWEFP